MIIRDLNTNAGNNFSKRKRFIKKSILLVLIIGFSFSAFIASKKLQSVGYAGIWDFVKTVSSNYFSGRKSNPETISIEIKDKEYKILEKNRKAAIERGVIINDLDGDYVPATITYNGNKIKVNLRLKGHMTDHLQENKWSFRVKIKDKDSFMGMKRFSIQHPGTRGYIYEWIFHELMKREDVVALRYKFINVSVNGNDWGIYAVEENFENELIENNNRKRGPIIRFNPDLYWVNRYNMMIEESSDDEYASYYSANPEAYRESKVLNDSVQKEYYKKAIGLVEGLRNRKINISQAFDVPRLAKFHAIIDLVGGIHSIDWSDIKYYYNPITAKLEPVAYESFTNLSSRSISGQYKYVDIDSVSNYLDWHEMIFSDKVFFSQYVKELERISNPKYLDNFFSDSNTELQTNLSIIHKEYPYKKFDKNLYYKRQAMILKVISPPKAIHAYLKAGKDNKIDIQVAAIDALPVQINSILVNNVKSSIYEIVLPAKQKNEYVNYSDIQFVMPADFKWNDKLVDSIIIEYSILGSLKKMETKVFSFPHTDNEFISTELANNQSNISDFPFLRVDENEKIILILPGNQIMDKDLIIPEGYRLVGNSSSSIDMTKGAKIISYSALSISGSDEKPFIFKSSDSTAGGIVIIQSEKSVLKYVNFLNIPKVIDNQWARSGGLTFYESSVDFENCCFYNCKSEDAVNIIRSDFSFMNCLFQNMQDDALDIDFSKGEISKCVFENCSENAVDINMGKVSFKSIFIKNSGNKGINIKGGSQVNGNDIRIKNSNMAVSAEDNSEVFIQKLEMNDCKIGLVGYNNKSGAGYPTIKVNAATFVNVKQKYLKEKKTVLVIDGIKEEEEVKNLETILKSEKKK